MTVVRIGRAGPALFARVHEWLRATPGGLVALALAVGAGAGAGAVAFRYLILGFTYAFSGHRDYSAAGHASYGYFHGIAFWFVVLAPVVGGLLYGPLIYFFAREARGHGVPEVMLAVAERGGRIRPQVAVVKSLASLAAIHRAAASQRTSVSETGPEHTLETAIALA